MAAVSILIMSPVLNHDSVFVGTFWSAVTIAMSIILFMSMSRIDQYRNLLFKEQLEMKSETLRRVHLGLFMVISTFMILAGSMKVALNRQRNLYCETQNDQHYDNMYNIEIIRGAIEILINIFWFFIIATMIVMYKRYFMPLSDAHQSRIRDGFRLLFHRRRSSKAATERSVSQVGTDEQLLPE